eukprot:scaffold153097_cov18-Tisochrysis_lutea.AAC.2
MLGSEVKQNKADVGPGIQQKHVEGCSLAGPVQGAVTSAGNEIEAAAEYRLVRYWEDIRSLRLPSRITASCATILKRLQLRLSSIPFL